jgi:hypothetical protein
MSEEDLIRQWQAKRAATTCPACGRAPCIRSVACLEEERLTALLDAAAARGEPLSTQPAIPAAPSASGANEPSAAYIPGGVHGDPVADEILRALQQAGAKGMTRTAIRDLFSRHKSGDRIGAALALLLQKGRARMDQAVSAGRPTETWFATKG